MNDDRLVAVRELENTLLTAAVVMARLKKADMAESTSHFSIAAMAAASFNSCHMHTQATGSRQQTRGVLTMSGIRIEGGTQPNQSLLIPRGAQAVEHQQDCSV